MLPRMVLVREELQKQKKYSAELENRSALPNLKDVRKARPS